ncbi:MAG: hypothetical protein JWR35_255 [Marmoricola sp.]|jgi:hypothetical protein|nr:hypothetical protein [Marmoricola sp.]
MAEPDQRARRTFGPVVLLGLAGGALAAVASAKPWVNVTKGYADYTIAPLDNSVRTMPLATALSFVMLATWGVLLVTRGRVRQVLAVVALLADLGLAASIVAGHRTLPGQLRESITGGIGKAPGVGFGGWFWASAVGCLVSLLATFLAVRYAREWPAMGSRYDAPGSESAPVVPETDRDLWIALDEGDDPTVQRDS